MNILSDDATTYRLAVDLMERGLYREAVGQLEPLAERFPDRSVRELLGRAYVNRARLAKGEAIFRALVDEYPDDPYLHEVLARVLRRRSRHDEADTHQRLAAALG